MCIERQHSTAAFYLHPHMTPSINQDVCRAATSHSSFLPSPTHDSIHQSGCVLNSNTPQQLFTSLHTWLHPSIRMCIERKHSTAAFYLPPHMTPSINQDVYRAATFHSSFLPPSTHDSIHQSGCVLNSNTPHQLFTSLHT